MKQLIQPLAWGLALASVLATASSLALSLVTPAAAATAVHEHHAHGPAPTLPAQASFATDAALREGMSRVRDAVEALGDTPADRRQAAELGDRIEAASAYLVANCHLPADADAALHGVLGDLLAGAEQLDAADPAPALARVHSGLARYQQLFNAPHWR
ncbi:DnrO protein [Pseudomonas oligotrophica]|uniref:DnrO protein n=1 Tax=Pseudomonas oligotrophica TaxID=2912055 RepID=UPI001F4565FA|nr:DnrO protein [Pseudomonas oligotrophica]MCF7201728.1 DnrO protein [Pseudomonas oligotrophica]